MTPQGPLVDSICSYKNRLLFPFLDMLSLPKAFVLTLSHLSMLKWPNLTNTILRQPGLTSDKTSSLKSYFQSTLQYRKSNLIRDANLHLSNSCKHSQLNFYYQSLISWNRLQTHGDRMYVECAAPLHNFLAVFGTFVLCWV